MNPPNQVYLNAPHYQHDTNTTHELQQVFCYNKPWYGKLMLYRLETFALQNYRTPFTVADLKYFTIFPDYIKRLASTIYIRARPLIIITTFFSINTLEISPITLFSVLVAR